MYKLETNCDMYQIVVCADYLWVSDIDRLTANCLILKSRRKKKLQKHIIKQGHYRSWNDDKVTFKIIALCKFKKTFILFQAVKSTCLVVVRKYTSHVFKDTISSYTIIIFTCKHINAHENIYFMNIFASVHMIYGIMHLKYILMCT